MAATLLITGGCGFVGSRIAKSLLRGGELSQQTGVAPPRITVLDSFIRSGSERNRPILECLGVEVVEGDLRDRSLIDSLPACDWVIDCAANPSVLAGLSPQSSSLELVDHNLGGTIHLLEYCKRHRAGLVLVSTSRIYSAGRLSAIPHRVRDSKIDVDWSQVMSDGQFTGLTEAGIGESFSVEPPLSLYGTTKLASEWLAMEYANAFGFPVWIDRCGVLAGAGQFGKADQGIVAYWMHRYLYGHPLKFKIGRAHV